MVTFVYPYRANMAQGNELKYSLRSLCKNFKDEFKVVIVGDKPDWLSDEARVIEGKFDTHAQPAINVAKKLEAVIKDVKMPHNFVWMNDDIYFMNDVNTDDLMQLKHLGKYDPNQNFTRASNAYHANAKRTFEWLKSKGKECYLYTTHLPFYYNKKKWRELFELLPLTETPYLLTLLYHNYHFESKDAIKINHHNEISVGCYRKLDAKESDMLSNLLDKTKFFNHSQTGFCSVVAMELRKRFGNEKCRFEI